MGHAGGARIRGRESEMRRRSGVRGSEADKANKMRGSVRIGQDLHKLTSALPGDSEAPLVETRAVSWDSAGLKREETAIRWTQNRPRLAPVLVRPTWRFRSVDSDSCRVLGFYR